MSPADLLRPVLCLALLCGGFAARAPAETRDKKEKPAKEEAPRAHWRVWKDRFSEARKLHVRLRPAARKAVVREMRMGAEGWRFFNYIEAATGSATIEITDDEDPKTKLVSLPVTLAEGSFFTLLLREREGAITAEWLDDAAPAEELGAAELTVRNFVPTLTTLHVKVGGDVSARLQTPESFLHVRGLPRQVVQVETAGTDDSGRNIEWTNEIDFKTSRRATLLIYPDSHGRVRPRVVIDGETAAAPPEEEDQSPGEKTSADGGTLGR